MRRIKNIMNDRGKYIDKIDIVIILILVFVYGIYSFINLGDTVAPQTFSTISDSSEQISVEVDGDAKHISFIRLYNGIQPGDFELYTSLDGENYEYINHLDLDSVFSWSDIEINREAKYITFVPSGELGSIGEMVVYDNDYSVVRLNALGEISRNVIDEGTTVPVKISYKNSTYFDEVYFARTAYDYVHGIQAYEWVHPPLGKLVQAIPIKLLGMTPFAWRSAGNICGILLIVVMYLFGKKMFGRRKWGLMAALLMMLDNFHFAQSRIGTIDTELCLFGLLSVYFMYSYTILSKKDSVKKRLKYLLLSGIFFGCTITTKWSGWFIGLLICIMFFAKLYKDNFTRGNKWTKDYTRIFLCCFIFFLLIPGIIYSLSYFLFPDVQPNYVNSFSQLIKQTKDIYNYHSLMTDGHPFSSPWYSWSVMYRPVWMHVVYYDSNIIETISGIGNPAIWWIGTISIIYALYRLIRYSDDEAKFLILAIFATWLPYLFIGRVMFMYHFFPTLPFMMLSIVFMFRLISNHIKSMIPTYIYLFIVFALFALFMPMTSGREIDSTYTDYFRWNNEWYFHG